MFRRAAHQRTQQRAQRVGADGLPAPELLAKSVYGLPEVHRAAIKGALLIASPDVMLVMAVGGGVGPKSTRE